MMLRILKFCAEPNGNLMHQAQSHLLINNQKLWIYMDLMERSGLLFANQPFPYTSSMFSPLELVKFHHVFLTMQHCLHWNLQV